MTVDFIIPCICTTENRRFSGMPLLKPQNMNRPHVQYWKAQCPCCGRGGIIEYPSVFKCLDAWNKMQKDLRHAQGIEIPFTQPKEQNGRCRCFTAPQCSCSDCPNSWFSVAEERYGEAAYDMGFEHVDCKNCYYNTGECKDCMFEGNPEFCPEESEDEKHETAE